MGCLVPTPWLWIKHLPQNFPEGLGGREGGAVGRVYGLWETCCSPKSQCAIKISDRWNLPDGYTPRTRLFLEIISTGALLRLRWGRGCLIRRDQSITSRSRKPQIWFPRKEPTWPLPARSPSLNHTGVSALVLPPPMSLKGPSGGRDKLGLGGLARTGQSSLVQHPAHTGTI